MVDVRVATAEGFGEACLKALLDAVRDRDHPVIGLPTGNTPVALYERLAAAAHAGIDLIGDERLQVRIASLERHIVRRQCRRRAKLRWPWPCHDTRCRQAQDQVGKAVAGDRKICAGKPFGVRTGR